MKDKNILITGVNGFVGQNCLKYFSASNNVYGLDIQGASSSNIVIDCVTEENILKFGKKFDVILHLAGSGTVGAAVKNKQKEHDKTIGSLTEVLNYIKSHNQTARLIFASSASVYGNEYDGFISEEGMLNPVSEYGKQKVEAENLLKKYSEEYGIDAKIIRFFSLYGIGNRKQLLFDILTRLSTLEGNVLNCFGFGSEKRDFVNIIDAVKFIDIVARQEKGYEIYNCGAGHATTVAEITEMLIKNFTDKNIEMKFDKIKRVGNPDNLLADITKAKKIGFVPEISLEEGVRTYVGWFKEI